jgi:hypothetical protein
MRKQHLDFQKKREYNPLFSLIGSLKMVDVDKIKRRTTSSFSYQESSLPTGVLEFRVRV